MKEPVSLNNASSHEVIIQKGAWYNERSQLAIKTEPGEACLHTFGGHIHVSSYSSIFIWSPNAIYLSFIPRNDYRRHFGIRCWLPSDVPGTWGISWFARLWQLRHTSHLATTHAGLLDAKHVQYWWPLMSSPVIRLENQSNACILNYM